MPNNDTMSNDEVDDTNTRKKREKDRDAEMFRALDALAALKESVKRLTSSPLLNQLRKAKAPRAARGPRSSLPICPKCRQRPIEYIEIWRNHTMRFRVDDEGRPNEEGTLHDGEPYCVEAECACGHRWRLKGVLQITDLEGLEP